MKKLFRYGVITFSALVLAGAGSYQPAVFADDSQPIMIEDPSRDKIYEGSLGVNVYHVGYDKPGDTTPSPDFEAVKPAPEVVNIDFGYGDYFVAKEIPGWKYDSVVMDHERRNEDGTVSSSSSVNHSPDIYVGVIPGDVRWNVTFRYRKDTEEPAPKTKTFYLHEERQDENGAVILTNIHTIVMNEGDADFSLPFDAATENHIGGVMSVKYDNHQDGDIVRFVTQKLPVVNDEDESGGQKDPDPIPQLPKSQTIYVNEERQDENGQVIFTKKHTIVIKEGDPDYVIPYDPDTELLLRGSGGIVRYGNFVDNAELPFVTRKKPKAVVVSPKDDDMIKGEPQKPGGPTVNEPIVKTEGPKVDLDGKRQEPKAPDKEPAVNKGDDVKIGVEKESVTTPKTLQSPSKVNNSSAAVTVAPNSSASNVVAKENILPQTNDSASILAIVGGFISLAWALILKKNQKSE